ncbi:M10 family metallopeptidase [Aliiroseovarius sp.]|uniref:M10 family metallopeptidase n=1 Tax=Aliiroseovarius sp. TaxID=1872442 RepID=UPI003BAC15B0
MCQFCVADTNFNPDALGGSVSLGEGAILPTYTHDQIADFLRTGYWQPQGISGGKFDVSVGGTLYFNVNDLPEAERYFARAAMEAWANVTGINMVETTSASADIVFVNDDGAGAYCTWDSYSGGTIHKATVNIPSWWISGDHYELDSYSFQTYIHEVGHALGLGHAGIYNGTATYATDGSGSNHYLNDSWQATVMSYFSQTENTYVTGSYSYVVTPMIADILAVHDIYGTPTTIRTGDTTYGNNSNAGGYLDDLKDSTNSVAMTIYDNGGIDTLDMSFSGANQNITLVAEQASDVAGGIGNLFIARGVEIENVIGGSGNDTLTGNDLNNELSGGSGADQMIGGEGNDTYYVDSAGDRVVETSGEGTDHVNSTISFSLRNHSQHIETLTLTGANNIDGTGNSLDNTIQGNDGDNVLNGAWGNDTLEGGAGNDVFMDDSGADQMIGGEGNDTYYVDSAGDRVVETSGEGTDHVNSTISFSLRNHSQHIETLTLTGANNIDGTGNGLDNTIQGNDGDNVLNGAWGNDTLEGGAGNDVFMDDSGADQMIGGEGNDTYYVDSAGDRVVETSGEGTDHVNSTISFSLRNHSQHIETLTLTGANNIDGTGNSLDNTIQGNDGDNVLNGAWGNDTLEGGAGNDVFMDDSGADQMIGGEGNDTYYVDSAGDRVVETSGEGTDHVNSTISFSLRNHSQHIETLTLTGANNIDGTGNSLDNTIQGNDGDNVLNGAWGNDTLEGGAGNDVFMDDSGNDTYSGGTGADTFVFTKGADIVVDFSVAENDLVLVDDSLWGGGEKSGAELLAYATIVGNDIVFDFGNGNTLTLRDFDDLGTLEGQLSSTSM